MEEEEGGEEGREQEELGGRGQETILTVHSSFCRGISKSTVRRTPHFDLLV